MDLEKLVQYLESNHAEESDEAKRKLLELSTQNKYKDRKLVNWMMDYFLKTGSFLILEVLVKVQSPHDIHIFDRLSDWLKVQGNRLHALDFFSFVVRKHPTWLYKVEKHKLFREVINLMLNEREIVPFMTALLCIITLLPIIPSSLPNYLNDLFKVFTHLASWNYQIKIKNEKSTHLQLGLQMLFDRLYGMFPCNFLTYLSEFAKKEKGAVFDHCIKPLFYTVRVHPMLVTATTDSEVNTARWKTVEPHDVVVDCEGLSLPLGHQDARTEYESHFEQSNLLETPGSATSQNSCYYDMNNLYPTNDPHYKSGNIPRFNNSNSNTPIWSPYMEMAFRVPVTPTPSIMMNLNNQLAVGTGSSPPEAAVEATPETTPLRDSRPMKHSAMNANSSVANPPAVRSILTSSQPSSPMRKDHNEFNFPPIETDIRHTPSTKSILDRALPIIRDNDDLTSSDLLLDARPATKHERRIQQVILERNQSHSPFQTIESQLTKLETPSPITIYGGVNTPEICSEVSTILVKPAVISPKSMASTIAKSDTKDPFGGNDYKNYSFPSGFTTLNSKSLVLEAKLYKKRCRKFSYNANSEYFSIRGTDKTAKTTNTSDATTVRRTKSCSSIYAVIKRNNDYDNDTVDSRIYVDNINNHPLQKSGKMLSIASETQRVIGGVSYNNCATQTLQTDCVTYENWLLDILQQTNNKRITYDATVTYPEKILDEYISHILRKGNNDGIGRTDQEQVQLMYVQLQYERYRRDIHAEHNRRLLGRSRDKRSLELERDRLQEQLKDFASENQGLTLQIDKTKELMRQKEQTHNKEINVLKMRYQTLLEETQSLRQANETLEMRLKDENTSHKDMSYELESLRGQIFNLCTDLQHAQQHADLGIQCRQEMLRLETEFIAMGEVQIKCRDRINELDSFKLRDEDQKRLHESFLTEVKDLKHNLEDKTLQLDSAKHKIVELQAQLLNCEKDITEQKRLLKTVKDEYEEKFKSLNKKYEIQKVIIMQIEEKVMMSQKLHTGLTLNACSPDTDKTDFASSMERNSPLSTSLASSESLSTSLRSTELRNLQQLVETPMGEPGTSINVVGAGSNIIEGTRLPTLDLASSANTATTSGINIIPASSNSTFNYDAVSASTSHHTHPHLHLQQQKR